MKHLMPIPSERYIPKLDEAQPLYRLLDKTLMEDNFNETVAIGNSWEIAKCEENLLEEVGYMFGADILTGDTDRVKRSKVAHAINHTKSRSTWGRIKELCDARTGLNTTMFVPGNTETEEFIVTSGTESQTKPLWSILGMGDREAPYGIYITGGSEQDSETVALTAGTFYIDLGSKLVPNEVIRQIREDLIRQVAAYFNVYIGYTEGDKYYAFPGGTL